MIESSTFTTIAQIIAITAFLMSLWNLVGPQFMTVRLEVIPEAQIQLIEDVQQGKQMIAFNILFTVFAKGPSIKWRTYKFMYANVTMPIKNNVKFDCRSYISESGKSQSNASRNIPVAINGRQSKTTTAAFQPNNLNEWLIGDYEISFQCEDESSKLIPCQKVKFSLDQKLIDIIKKPQSTLTMSCKIL